MCFLNELAVEACKLIYACVCVCTWQTAVRILLSPKLLIIKYSTDGVSDLFSLSRASRYGSSPAPIIFVFIILASRFS